MSFSRIQKRKWPGCNSGPRSHTLPAHKDFRSTTPAAPAPLFTDDENNPFPSDQITSDPTFFDDFVPSDLSRSLSSPVGHSLHITPPTSPMSSPHSIWTLPKDADKLATSIALSDSKELDQKNPLMEPSARLTTSQSLSRFKRRKVVTTDSATPSGFMREIRDGPDTSLEQATMTTMVTQPQQISDDGPTIRAQSIPAIQAEMHVGEIPQTASTPTIKSGETGVRPEENDVEIPESSNAAVDLSSPSSPRTRQPIQMPQPVSTSSTTTKAANEVRWPRRSLPTPKLVQSPKQARAQNVRKRKKSSNGTSSSNPGGPEFTINKSSSSQAYQVKHRTESQSEAGKKWSKAKEQKSFHIEITKQARVRYTVGDIVSILFPRGEAGSAKIVEVRMADGGTLSIVVQWLYSRSDAIDMGGVVPRLEQWPHDLYMISDHFQVICVENINGKSDATAVDDFYWVAGGPYMQPLTELQERLKK